MIERIELSDMAFTKDILVKTTFFQFAERGAMGDPGGILFLTEDGLVYHAYYCHGDLMWDTVSKAFPIINKCHFGMFGTRSTVPDGWAYMHLGMGNHLIVRKDRYDRFALLVSEYTNPGELYQHWLEKALLVNCPDMGREYPRSISTHETPVEESVHVCVWDNVTMPLPDDIIVLVGNYYKVSSEDIKGPSKQHNAVMARNVSAYLIRNMTNQSLRGIGEIINRHPLTVKTAIKKVEDQFKCDLAFAETVHNITSEINHAKA